MEIRALLGVNIFLLGIITYFMKSWVNEIKMEMKEMKDKQYKMDISFTRLQTRFGIQHEKGE